MAKTIKGINVVIGSDVTPLGKALQDVNKHSKDIAAELRKVNNALKFNPKDTELLAQKQKLLGEQVAVTREKLDKLRAAQEQVNEQFKRGEISEEQYRAFQREIIETESKLKHFEKQLRETGMTAEQLGKKMKDAGKKMTDVGKSLSMKVTAPIVGLGAVIAKTGMEFEAAMSEVGAISGATGEDLAALEAMAKEMGATTKFSASEAAEGLKYMAMAGWDTQQQLAGLPGVLSLAAASGEDLGTVSDIVTDAMTAFGMEAARAGEFADTLAAAASSSNTNVSMLGESFKNVAPVAGALGFEAKDTAIALGLMANAGIKGGQAGTSMRSILTRLVKPTKESGTAMDQLGISLTDSEGNMKSLEAVMGDLRSAFRDLDPDQKAFYAAQIAGQQGMSGLLAIVNAAEDDFNDLSNAINNSTGEAERMSREMQDNLQGRLTELKSAIEGAALQLYDAMLPALEKVVAIIQKVVAWFSELSPEVKQTIVVVAGLAAAIGPLLVVIGTLVSSIGTIVGALGAISVGPIVAVVAAVGALIAAIVALWKNNEGFRDGVMQIWETIKATVGPVIDGIKETIGKMMESIGPSLDVLKNAFAGLLPVLQMVGAIIGGVVAVAFAVVTGIINGVINAIAPLIQAFGGLIAFVTNVVGAIVSLFKGDFAGAWDYLKDAGQGFVDFFSGIVKAIFGFVSGLVTGVIDFFKSLYNALIGHSIIPDLINGIIGWFKGLPGKIIEFIKNMMTGIIDGIKSRVSSVTRAIGNVVSSIKDRIASLPGDLLQAGRNMIASLAQGIRDRISGVTSAIGNVAQKIRDFLPFSPAKIGPLRILPDFGDYFVRGIRGAERDISVAMSRVMGSLSPQIALPRMGNRGVGAPTTSHQDLNININFNGLPADIDEISLKQFLLRAIREPGVSRIIDESLHRSTRGPLAQGVF